MLRGFRGYPHSDSTQRELHVPEIYIFLQDPVVRKILRITTCIHVEHNIHVRVHAYTFTPCRYLLRTLPIRKSTKHGLSNEWINIHPERLFCCVRQGTIFTDCTPWWTSKHPCVKQCDEETLALRWRDALEPTMPRLCGMRDGRKVYVQ